MPVPLLRRVPVADLHPDPGQPRRAVDQAGIEALASSIAASGLLHPILVSPRPEGGWRVAAGWRRRCAVEHLGWEEVDVLVLDQHLPPLVQAAENTARSSLLPGELRAVIAEAASQGIGTTEIAGTLGISDRLVRYYQAISAHPDLVTRLEEGTSLRAVLAELRRRNDEAAGPAQPAAAAPSDRDSAAAASSPEAATRRAEKALAELGRVWPELPADDRARLRAQAMELFAPDLRAELVRRRGPAGT